MNAFIGISKSHTTTSPWLAPASPKRCSPPPRPGRGDPAVVMYNMFSRWIAGYRALHADASAEILPPDQPRSRSRRFQSPPWRCAAE